MDVITIDSDSDAPDAGSPSGSSVILLSSPKQSVHVPNTQPHSSPVVIPVSDDSEVSFGGARSVLKSLMAVMSDTSDIFIPSETQKSAKSQKAAAVSSQDTSTTSGFLSKFKELSDPIESSPVASQTASSMARKSKLSHKSHLDKFMSNGSYSAKEIKEANRVTRSKEELLAEMVMQISDRIYDQFDASHLENVFATSSFERFDEEYPIIVWKRKVKALYDKERDVFIPCLPTHITEKCVVVYMKAGTAVQKMQDRSLHELVQNCRRQYDGCHIIVMLEGLQQYVNKVKNLENKQYKRQVLDNMNGDAKRRKKDDPIDISSKDLDKFFNKMQHELDIITFPVRTNQEAVEWLFSFTYTIAFALYDKFERNAKYSNLGSIKSGADNKGTFVQSMNQFRLMSLPRSERLYNYHNSIYSVYSKFQRDGSLGTDSSGKSIVPPSTENAMKRFFTSDDPNEIIHD